MMCFQKWKKRFVQKEGLFVTPVGIEDEVRLSDFNDIEDILSDYAYFVKDGWKYVYDAFDTVNSLLEQINKE